MRVIINFMNKNNFIKIRCVNSFEAHNYGVLSLAYHDNLLYSTSNKGFKIWSCDKLQLIKEITDNQNSVVKSVALWPDKFNDIF